ncbi:hypothetical protein BC940DRAFT_369153 [Gongronella butleri]|nr:hypothetical protein BC940DRAFT_369153 [Gongronella butleri]
MFPLARLARPVALRAVPLVRPSCFYTTAASADSITDTVTKEFIQQAKKGNRSKKTPSSEFIVIDGLPATTTVEDIRKLAREAISQGDSCIREVIFCRQNDFKFFGRCVVQMDNSTHAGKLAEYGHMRLVGGSHIKMKLAGQESSDSKAFINRLRRPELTSVADASSAAGRSVLVTGLPPKTSADQVLGILRSKNLYPADGTSQSVVPLRARQQAAVAKYLVKFESESEAWRCVRAFHNTNFNLKTSNTDYRLDVSVVY